MKKEFNYRPYKKGRVKVTHGHQLYYELYGNPKGRPVVFLHGGPGAGFSETDKRFFDPKVWNVLIFDQRGSGNSTPFASIKNNTTWDLVKDIKYLIDKFNFGKPVIFGGSWGSTLALVYAISYPETVSGLILRGVYLSTQLENKHYVGGGVRNFFPEAWERFMNLVPKKFRRHPEAYYFKQMQSKDEKVREKYTYEWSFYELSLLKLKMTTKQVEGYMKTFSYQSMSPLEAYYIANGCFLEENFILKNIGKIQHIPTVIVHGRYDFICPPISARSLHQKLKNSELHLVVAGHSSSEKAIEKKLIEVTKLFAEEH